MVPTDSLSSRDVAAILAIPERTVRDDGKNGDCRPTESENTYDGKSATYTRRSASVGVTHGKGSRLYLLGASLLWRRVVSYINMYCLTRNEHLSPVEKFFLYYTEQSSYLNQWGAF